MWVECVFISSVFKRCKEDFCGSNGSMSFFFLFMIMNIAISNLLR